MLEIILGVWLVCFIFSSSLVAANYYRLYRRLHSRSLSRVNANLAKINLFWSSTQDRFVPLTEEIEKKDRQMILRSALILELLAFASVIGFLILFVVILSMVFLLKNRKESALFKSQIAKVDNLPENQIQEIMQVIDQV